MAAVANPYANQDLFISADFSSLMTDIVARSEKEAFKPFPRQVDAWWFALGVGVRIGELLPLTQPTVKFNDGGILSSDPWRITHLELLALAKEGAPVLENPGQVIRIAAEYANAGFKWLMGALLGEAEPTLTLMNAMQELST